MKYDFRPKYIFKLELSVDKIKKLQKIIFLSVFIFLQLDTAVASDSFSSEASFNFFTATLDDGGDFSSYGVNVMHYFYPVSIDRVPLSEAGFINRTSSIEVNLAKGIQNSAIATVNSIYNIINVTYVIPNSSFVIDGGFRDTRLDDGLTSESRTTGLSLGAGYYPMNNLMYSTSYERETYSGSSTINNKYKVGMKWVKILGMQKAINIKVDLTRDYVESKSRSTETSNFISLVGDYYSSPLVSFGLRYYYQYEDDYDFAVRTYVAATKVFVTKNFYIDADIRKYKFEYTNGYIDDAWHAGVGYRF